MLLSRKRLSFSFAILFFNLGFVLTATTLGQSTYSFTVVAKADGSQFLSLDPSVSINDNGSIAFFGQFNRDGRRRENLFIFDGATGNTRKLLIDGFELEVPSPSPDDFGQVLNPGIQINNQNITIVRRRMNARIEVGGVRSIGPFTYIEGWGNGNLPIQFAMGDAEVGPAAPLLFFLNPSTGAVFPSPFAPNSPFGLLFQWASINNKGQVVFSAGKRNSGRTDRYLATPISPPYIYNRVLIPGDSSAPLPRPVIADDGNIVTRFPGPTGDELRLFSYDLSSFTTIAGPQNGFTTIGRSPSISDDGKIIVFVGLAGNNAPLHPGPGVFVAMQSIDKWEIKRIAGISGDGYLDPGETFEDTNKNGVFDPGEKDSGPFAEFQLDERVAVSNSGVIIFKAKRVDGDVAVYSIGASASASPALVVKKGDSIAGLSGPVQDMRLYDSINNLSNPQIALWVDLGNQKNAIVATSPCSAQRISNSARLGASINNGPFCPFPQLEFEALSGNKPIDQNPEKLGGGNRIFPDKDNHDEDKLTANRRRIVRIKAKGFGKGIPLHFRSFDVDDPSRADQDSEGNDNIGGPFKPGDLSEKEADSGNRSAVTVRTNAEGEAEVYLTVTMQPGNNFRVAASHDESLLNDSNLKVVGIDLKDADGNDLPADKVAVSPMLTVWRRLHIELKTMGRVSGNFVKGQILNVSYNPSSGLTEIFVDQSLDQRQFQNGRISINDVGDVAVEDNSGPELRPALLVGSTVFVRGSVQVPAEVLLGLSGKSFTLYDDDDFNGNDGGEPDGDEVTKVDEKEDIPLPDNSLLQESSEPDKNLLAEAYVMPTYINTDRPAKPVLNAPGKSLVGGFINMLRGRLLYPFIYNLIEVSNFEFEGLTDKAYWTICITSLYQAFRYSDFDPDSEGGVVGTTPAGSNVCFIFKEAFNPRERHNKGQMRNEARTVAHEVGHLLGLPHSNGGIMIESDASRSNLRSDEARFSGANLRVLDLLRHLESMN